MNTDYTDSISRPRFLITLTIFGVLFLFLVYSEYLNAMFNHKYDGMGLSLLERIRFAFKPSVMVIYVIFTSLLFVLVARYLKPLFSYLKDGTNYDQARGAAIRMPWAIIIFQVSVWIVGTTAYYAVHNWVAESGIHYYFGITTKVVTGLLSALYVTFIINLILKEAKESLHITDIRENENDIFSRIKDHLAVVAASFFIFVYGSYIAFYYAGRSQTVDLGNFLALTLPAGISILIVGIIPIFLSKREYMFQIRILHRELKNLSMSSANLSDNIFLINFDELGVMAARVNEVIKRFRTLLENIQATVDKLAESSVTLSVASQESSTSSNQQAAAVAEVVSTMEDSDRLSTDIGTRMKNVEEKSIKARESVHEGVETVNQYTSTMESVRSANEETITFISSLNQDVKAIWEVITIINSIADQVKIIAFNAELEASAAGPAGKNFEIVATEIRRLADNTMASTAEIRNKIGIIEKGSNSLIDASRKSTELIEAGWELSSRTGQLFQEIMESSDETSAAAKSVTDTVNIQIHGFEQILITMKQIAEGANNFALSTTATSDTADDLKQLVTSLQKLAGNVSGK